MLLPYELDEATSARKLDGNPASGNAELYQIGQNPFETGHAATQLWQILKNFTAHVDAGEWDVDDNGGKRLLLFLITSSFMEWIRTAMKRKMCITRSCGICICRSCFVEPEAHYSANARMIVCKVSTMAGDHASFLQRNMLHLTKQSA